ncbi:uncharacterized protein MELLADRAFT_94638 [Melampsora larici-populina 98AG31]|uniref:Uncharacterized protein n=1 Tax=Melampsora larici-populina (strain 98AG31 / pathotype 3-4-7) TaxID=747676 RepID=F4S7F1_MELLP|nr:uncharacterized protein MELLADRAFT_94638 [Melampsora larici-populina 98AG31]EGF99435.1 hypothetical protein MELLADRAFT_94638 [Melampsora larici-populina 98AG31]
MRPSNFASPASNYDRLASTPNLRLRQASAAFGLDIDPYHRTPPNLRQQTSGMFRPEDSTDEPNYRLVLDDDIQSTSNSTQPEVDSRLGREDIGVDHSVVLEWINSFGDKFGLTLDEKAEVEIVFKQSNNVAREIATMCFYQSQFAKLEKKIDEQTVNIPTTPITTGVNLPQLEFHFNTSVRSYIWEQVKEALVGSAIQSYATNFTSSNEPILDSFENHMITIILNERTKVPDTNLPEGFRASDPTADTQVRKVVKEIGKSERNKFQNTKLPENPSRNLGQHIDCRQISACPFGTMYLLQPKDSTQPREGLSKNKFERSMWDPVDERLTWIRSLKPDHQKLFYKWIMHYDGKIFTGNNTFEEIKKKGNIHILDAAEFGMWIIEGCPIN